MKFFKYRLIFNIFSTASIFYLIFYYYKEKQYNLNPITNEVELTFINDKIKSYISSYFYHIVMTDYKTIDLKENINLQFLVNSLQKDISKISEENFGIGIDINEVLLLNYDFDIFYILDNGKIIISLKCLEDMLENKDLLLVMSSLELSSIILNNYFYNKSFLDSFYYNFQIFKGFTNNISDQNFINDSKKIYFSKLNKTKLNSNLNYLNKLLNKDKNLILDILKSTDYFNNKDNNLKFLSFSNRYENLFN